MPRTKKASADQPPAKPDESTAGAHEAAENEGMAHVPADSLAGSPNIFAPKWEEQAKSSEAATASADAPQPEADVPAATPPADSVEEAPPTTATEPAPVEPPPPMPEAAVESVPIHRESPSPATTAQSAPPTRGRAGSSIALGIVLVVVGLFFLVIRLFNIDLSAYGWPLFVIVPGLTLLVVGFASLGTGAAIPGGIITMLGLVLAYQNASGDWASWAYAWALVAPFGVGLGMYVQGLRVHSLSLIRQGRAAMFAGALIFMIGFVFFESVLNISGLDYGYFGKAALPALLIVIGIVLLVRSMQRSSRA